MYFGFNIGIYDCGSQKVKEAVIRIMQDNGFYWVDRDQARQSLSISEETLRYHQINDQISRIAVASEIRGGFSLCYTPSMAQ